MQRSATLILLLLAVAGCAEPTRERSSPTAPVETPAVPSAVDASFVPQGPLDLLECEGPPSPMGGRADNFGPDGGGATADEAFDAWVASNPFTVPRAGYEPLGTIGDRSVYAYKTGGQIKVIVVISPRFGEMVNSAFTIEEMRTCDPSEYGAEVDLGPLTRTWVHETTGALLSDIAGPAHCGWESTRLLHLDDQGVLRKQYVRDPLGVLADTPSLLDTYGERVDLPSDATFSGYRTDDGQELWFTDSDTAAYVATPEGIERWPRAEPPIGCA